MSAPHVVRLYESRIPSGNAYKVTLLMAHLGVSADVVALDILASPSETRRPEFLAKNPNGRIPVVELSDGSFLPESNAILCYLADGTPYVPADPLHRARALGWMFFEQYSHEPFVAVLKFWTYWGGLANKSEAELVTLHTRGNAALSVMATHLLGSPWFTGPSYGIADHRPVRLLPIRRRDRPHRPHPRLLLARPRPRPARLDPDPHALTLRRAAATTSTALRE